ncbi:MAG: DNA repair protein RecO [Blautia sp.]|nr:DNA repair protein RecO [Blautia sp.]
MSETITVQGAVLSAMPVGEYDRRIVILTRERGKISAFAKGARRQNSPLLAVSNPFVFGSFTLYEGRTSYSLREASVTRYFADLASLYPGVYYGYYFLELADYFGKEGLDEKEMLNLLYVTLLALMNPSLPDRLIRCAFELRIMKEQGLMPWIFSCPVCGKKTDHSKWYFTQDDHGLICEDCLGRRLGFEGNASETISSPGKREGFYGGRQVKALRISYAAIRMMQYIVSCTLKKLYTFTAEERLLRELEAVILPYTAANIDRRLKSLPILETMIDSG